MHKKSPRLYGSPEVPEGTADQSTRHLYSRRRFLMLGAGVAAALALGVSTTQSAEAMPYPLPLTSDREKLNEEARQNIQRQLALGIANYLNPQQSEDARIPGARVQPAELTDISASNLNVNKGFDDYKDRIGRLAFFSLMPAFGGDEAYATFFAERVSGHIGRRVFISATVEEGLAAGVINDSIRGAGVDLDVIQQIAGDPGTAFDSTFLRLAKRPEYGFEDELGTPELPISNLPVAEFGRYVMEFSNFIDLKAA